MASQRGGQQAFQ